MSPGLSLPRQLLCKHVSVYLRYRFLSLDRLISPNAKPCRHCQLPWLGNSLGLDKRHHPRLIARNANPLSRNVSHSTASLGAYGHNYAQDASIHPTASSYDETSQSGEIGIKSERPPSGRKRRLDEVCVERFPQYSRTVIQSWILQGKVLVKGRPVTKAGASIPPDAEIRLTAEEPKFVCRAGLKLEKALDHFGVDVTGKVVMDAGLSTGGFCDCLLQRGATLVYGVDVGYGQVSEKIRVDPRVVVMERTNLRHLRQLPPAPDGGPCQGVDLVTLDLSFISVLMVMEAVLSVLKKPGGELLVLIKPQFEAKKGQVGKGGIIRDPAVHAEILDKVVRGIQSHGFRCQGTIESPVKGATGNTEFLGYFCLPELGDNGVELPNQTAACLDSM